MFDLMKRLSYLCSIKIENVIFDIKSFVLMV
jgi:hypothetical protein